MRPAPQPSVAGVVFVGILFFRFLVKYGRYSENELLLSLRKARWNELETNGYVKIEVLRSFQASYILGKEKEVV